jgi:rhodanese-related sulfurtransferase
MKRMERILAVSVALTLAVFTGCSSDDDDDNNDPTPVNEFELLVDHLDDVQADLTTGWIQTAEYVNTNLADLFIVDIRAADAYGSGHVPGAHNVAATDVLDYVLENNTGDMPVAVVCYTGQTASFVTMGLRMMGVDAFAMKWGMSGWHNDFDSWTANVGSNFVGDFVNTAAPALPENAFPTLSTGLDNAEAILAARVEAMLAEGFTPNGITAAGVFSALDDYSVFNYWAESDYLGIGHVPGAYQMTPGNLTSDMYLNALDPDGDNVIYCWTGQTSALMTFYLNVLGYDAFSLKFGANGMVWESIPGHQWMGGAGYAYEGGQAVNEFDVLVEHLDSVQGTLTTGWIQTAEFVHDTMEDLFIVDIRAADAYNTGHVPGAHNVAAGEVLDYVLENNTGDLPVAVVCYTGQTASFVTMGLRMMGVDAFAMKWGMSGWHSDFDSWTANVSSNYVGDFVNTDAPALGAFGYPTLATGLTSADAILAARVDAMFAEGFTPNGVSASTVYGALEDYQIFNYWGESDYLGIGHIDGAFQLTPGTVKADQNLAAFDPDAMNVIYCWTGQTSALMTFYMNVLGYDAYSLKFGANGMVWDNIPGHQWTAGAGYDYE